MFDTRLQHLPGAASIDAMPLLQLRPLRRSVLLSRLPAGMHFSHAKVLLGSLAQCFTQAAGPIYGMQNLPLETPAPRT